MYKAVKINITAAHGWGMNGILLIWKLRKYELILFRTEEKVFSVQSSVQRIIFYHTQNLILILNYTELTFYECICNHYSNMILLDNFF